MLCIARHISKEVDDLGQTFHLFWWSWHSRAGRGVSRQFSIARRTKLTTTTPSLPLRILSFRPSSTSSTSSSLLLSQRCQNSSDRASRSSPSRISSTSARCTRSTARTIRSHSRMSRATVLKVGVPVTKLPVRTSCTSTLSSAVVM